MSISRVELQYFLDKRKKTGEIGSHDRMARKKEIVNNTPYPQHAIDTVARCLWPDIVAFFESEEGQKEFEAWKRQQDKEHMEQENQLKAA